MAFTSHNGMSLQDLMNPMIGFYADQASQHAARNPNDANAIQQAQYWAGLLAQQRQAQAIQQMTQVPLAGASLIQPTQGQPNPVPTFGAPGPQPQAPGPTVVQTAPSLTTSIFSSHAMLTNADLGFDASAAQHGGQELGRPDATGYH